MNILTGKRVIISRNNVSLHTILRTFSVRTGFMVSGLIIINRIKKNQLNL
jgi:hypothetical protein